MRQLLALLWRIFSLLGLALSLRRWWRTLTDEEESREQRLMAGGILVVLVGLMIWSIISDLGVRQPTRQALAAPAVPAATEIVADLRDDLSVQAIDRWDDGLGVEFRPNSPSGWTHRLMIADVHQLSAAQRQALLDRLRHDPKVEAADENFSVTLLGAPTMTPNDPRYAEQWNFPMIGMPRAWEKSTGAGAVVAVIDTGVAFEREKDVPVASDLKGTKWRDAYDFTTNKAKSYDDHGHGTHVTGTIAQTTNNKHGTAGIAYNATIMPLKVLTGQGYGNVSDIADAITYAADHGANVINMSLGGPRSAAVMRRACTYAHQRGVAIVCAAGNSGREGVGYPAAYPECIAVSAVGPSGNLTFYSSWGQEVAIAAPGGEYRSPDEKQNGILQNTVFDKKDVFEAWQGTSMASPHVAGVAALLVAEGVKGPEAIRNRLQKSATPKGEPQYYGAGLLNAAAAVGSSVPDEQMEAAAAPVHRGLAAILLFALAATLLSGLARPRGASSVERWQVVLTAAGVAFMLATLPVRGLLAGALTFVGWPLAAVVLGWGVRSLRPALAGGVLGFAVGCLALSGSVPLGWLVLNALLAWGLVGLVARPQR